MKMGKANNIRTLETCHEYLEDGICRTVNCIQRHPRHCRYWTKRLEGCKRGISCQYLHVESMKYVVPNMQSTNGPTTNEQEVAFTSETENVMVVFSCDECTYTINNELLLTAHVATHHKKLNQLSCDECPFVAKNKGGLTRHTNSKHRVAYSCDSCDFTSQTNSGLMEHHTTTHNLNVSSTSDRQEESNIITFNFPINFPTTPHY